MQRRTFIRNAALAGGMMAVAPIAACSGNETDYDFPLLDLHVHLTNYFTIDNIMEISRATNVRFGIVENPGGRVHDDESLRAYIEMLRPYPVYIGLQPMSPGWTENFSPRGNSGTRLCADGSADCTLWEPLRRDAQDMELRHLR